MTQQERFLTYNWGLSSFISFSKNSTKGDRPQLYHFVTLLQI